jgi:hypothetical protein
VTLLLDDLSEFGRAMLEDDDHGMERRDGGKASGADFVLGWIALAARYTLWSQYTAEVCWAECWRAGPW